MSLLEALGKTSMVAYDGCHKIYLIREVDKKMFQDYELVEGSIETRLEQVETWWENSCALRFIEWIGEVYTTIVPQGGCNTI